MTYATKLLSTIEKHDFSQTKILLNEALRHDDPEILASLAANLSDQGFTDLSQTIYQALIKKFPKEALFKVYLAEILFNDGDEDRALTLLYDIGSDSPAYVPSLLVQADYYQTNGLIETARQKLLTALKLAPQEDAIKFGLAELDHLSGHYEEALVRYQDLLTRQATFQEVVLQQRVMTVLAKLGRYEEAAAILNEDDAIALDLDSEYEAGLIMLAVDNPRQAITYLRHVLKTSPDYVNAYPLLAQAYEKEHQEAAVLETSQAGLTYNEFDEDLYEIGARAATNLHQMTTAEKLLKRGLKVAPENGGLLLQLSNLYLYEGKDSANIDLLSQVDKDQLEPQAHWNMAVSNQRLEKFDVAKSEFLLAYPSFSENPDFLRQMIHFCQEISDQDLLKLLLVHYLKLVPDDMAMQQLHNELA